MPSAYCTAGRLRETITFQSPTMPTTGETTPTYAAAAAPVRAEVLPLSGLEANRQDQIEGMVKWRVIARYRSDVLPTWQISWGSRTLGIVSAFDPDGRRSWLVCECQEVEP